MKFTKWTQSHHRSILFLVTALAISGLLNSFRMPVSLFPHVSFPRVVVNLEAGDRPAGRMAIKVTRPVEEAVRSVPGVRSIRSTTSRGSADVSINFGWGQDMVAAMLQVESAINKVMGSLPRGTTFNVRRMNPTVFPVLGYSITSKTRSLVKLRDLAMYQLRPVLSTVQGVSRIGVLGGSSAEYRVVVNLPKLYALGMDTDDVARALSASNVIKAVGRLEDHDKLYLMVSDTQFKDFNQIGKTILRSGDNGLVRLDDIATIVKATTPEWKRVTADGRDAVLLQIYQQPGGNTVQIARQIRKTLTELQAHLPKDIKIHQWYDQSRLIMASAKSVRDATIIGIVLAMVVILMFLRNVKFVLIAAVSVPTVLAATVFLLYVLHMSFNIMTLGGIASAVGLIIDDVIVMVEQIVNKLHGGIGDYRERISVAVTEFTRPLAGSSASTTIIFAPLAFLTGVTGAFFKALSITMATGLIVSFFVAWVAVPLLSIHLLNQKDIENKVKGIWLAKTQWLYGKAMRILFSRPWFILAAILPLVAIGWVAYKHIGSGFMPPMDEGGFILDYRSSPGTSLRETDRLLRQVEAILQATPEVSTYSRRTGLQLGGGVTEANEGDFFVRLKPQPRRPIVYVMDDIRQRIEHEVPGLQIEMAQLMEDLIGDLTAVPQPIEIKLFSDNGKLLRKLGPVVADKIRRVPGVVDVNNGIVLAGDAIDIQVNRVKAALEGIRPETISHLLEDYLSGIVTTQIQQGPRMIGLRVWIPRKERSTVNNIYNLSMRAPDGHIFPLKRVASIKIINGQAQIMRENLKRMIAVTARITGRDMGSTIRDVSAVLNQQGFLPHDVYYKLGGLYEQQQIAFKGLAMVFISATVLVFLLILFLYESFRISLAMLLTSLSAAAAVFIGLWLTGTELNITAIMGMTMIIGIATEAAIFYYSEYRQLPEEQDPRERMILAGKNRMRPIAMTTIAAILALLPLALGIGEGAAMLKPLAIAIISGLAVQLPLVLILLPVLIYISGK